MLNLTQWGPPWKETKFHKALFFALFSLNTSFIMSYIGTASPTPLCCSHSTIHVNPPTWKIWCSIISHLENCISLLPEPMELPSDSCSESIMLLPAWIQPFQVFTCNSSSVFTMLALCCWLYSALASVDGLQDSKGELPTFLPDLNYALCLWGFSQSMSLRTLRSLNTVKAFLFSFFFELDSGRMNFSLKSRQQSHCPSSAIGRKLPHVSKPC